MDEVQKIRALRGALYELLTASRGIAESDDQQDAWLNYEEAVTRANFILEQTAELS